MPLLLALPAPALSSSGGHVQLLPYSATHNTELSALLSDPKVWEQGFAPGRTTMPRTTSEMAEFLAQRAQVPALFTILLDGKVAGTTGVVRIYPHRSAALVGRTVLGVPFWGQGLNRRAKELLFEWLFSCGARTIECEVAQSNQRSLSSLQSMGFTVRGTRRRATPGGRAPWRNLALLSVGKSQWMSARELANVG